MKFFLTLLMLVETLSVCVTSKRIVSSFKMEFMSKGLHA